MGGTFPDSRSPLETGLRTVAGFEHSAYSCRVDEALGQSIAPRPGDSGGHQCRRRLVIRPAPAWLGVGIRVADGPAMASRLDAFAISMGEAGRDLHASLPEQAG